MLKKGRIAIVISIAAIILTIGAATAFTANDAAKRTVNAGWWSSIWNILTDDQKTQLADEAVARLDQKLAVGRISQEQYEKGKEAIINGEMPFFGKFGRGSCGDMTDEQKAAIETMRSNREEMRSKWEALTDAQKVEIYNLDDQKTAINSQLIDKYLEFGVIDTETAESIRGFLESRKNDMRTTGRMPMPGGRGMGCGKTFGVR